MAVNAIPTNSTLGSVGEQQGALSLVCVLAVIGVPTKILLPA
jgi:hypothetical protein